MREVTCPGCGEILGVSPELEGGRIRCSVCEQVIETAEKSPRPKPLQSNDRDAPRTDDPLERGRNRYRSEDRDDNEAPRSRRRTRSNREDDFDKPKKKSGCGMWVWILGITGVLILGCCGGGGFLAYKFSDPKWEKFTSPDGSWSADFPGKTKMESKPIEGAPEAGNATFYVAQRLFGREAFLVGFAELNPLELRLRTVEQILIESLDGILKSPMSPREISRRNLKMAGVDAKELTLDVIDPKMGAGRMVARVLVANDRIYTLIVVKTGQGAGNPEQMEQFFNSFTLTPKK